MNSRNLALLAVAGICVAGCPSGSDDDTDSHDTESRYCSTDGESETQERYEAQSVLAGAECKSEAQKRTCDNGTWGEWSGSYTFETCNEDDTTEPAPGPCTKEASAEDGTVDSRTMYTYDDQGNLLSEERDYGDDGTVDSRTVFTYTYDDQGSQLSAEMDYAGDGTVDSRYAYAYDEHGNMLSWETDKNADGTADRRYTYTYDERGNKLSEEEDKDNDGSVDSRYAYTYEEHGNRLSEEQDYGADGTVEYRYAYTYDCWY